MQLHFNKIIKTRTIAAYEIIDYHNRNSKNFLSIKVINFGGIVYPLPAGYNAYDWLLNMMSNHFCGYYKKIELVLWMVYLLTSSFFS